MSDIREPSTSDSHSAEPAGLRSLTRRRALLKGVGKAGAIAGSALPLSSLATGDKPGMRLPKSGKYYMCSVSGQNSVMASAQASAKPICGGKGVSFYQKVNGKFVNWPGGVGGSPVLPCGGRNYVVTAPFSTVFGCTLSVTYSYKGIGTLVQDFPHTDEAHWIVALLNAAKFPSEFPNTSDQIVEMCKTPAKRAPSLAFFINNLEQG